MIEIINADCLEYIKNVADKTFDAVITDPPYKQEAHTRGLLAKRKCFKEMSAWTNMENDWYNESFLDELVRICKFPNIVLFCGKRDLAAVLYYCESKNYFYHVLPVIKKSPMPMTDNTWLSNEYAVHFTDRKIVYSKRYEDKLPYFIVGGKKETQHPNEKDRDMVIRIIRNITQEGDKVFDPFLGSGTTSVCCQALNRDCVGVELSSNYCQLAKERLDLENAQLDLFKTND
ncbi:MAG: hypothetical protein J1F17_01705 [Oscillospiraceae bacterium]|nr:hypothetical protein [Oscillospiraceae bacterium]